jgi:predicted XRE-type DNA-binding protein
MDINDLTNEGFEINQGDLFEYLLMQSIANNLMQSEMLKQIMEIKHLIKEDELTEEEIHEELTSIFSSIQEMAEEKKNDWISKAYMNNRNK